MKINTINKNELCGYWTLGSDSLNDADTFQDKSGNNNDGDSNNIPSFVADQNGVSNAAMTFNGSDDDVVELSSQVSFANNEPWSVSFWINGNDLETGAPEQYFLDADNSDHLNYHSQNKITWYGNDGSYTGVDWDGEYTFSNNVWYNLQFVCDGTKIGLYVDGSHVSDKIPNDNNTSYKIDYISRSGGNGFEGSISDIAIYSKALAQSEINQLYNAGKTTAKIKVDATNMNPDSYDVLNSGVTEGNNILSWASDGTDALLAYQNDVFTANEKYKIVFNVTDNSVNAGATLILRYLDESGTTTDDNGNNLKDLGWHTVTFIQTYVDSEAGRLQWSLEDSENGDTFIIENIYIIRLQNVVKLTPFIVFKSTWITDNNGTSDDDQITLPLISTGTYDFTVDWGDGNTDHITTYDQSEVTHTFSSTGEYTININGEIEGWQFNNGGDCEKITDIYQWGNFLLGTDEGSYFYGCSNLYVFTTDEIDVSDVTSMENAFRSCLSLTTLNISNWDVSNVTDMSHTFRNCESMTSEQMGATKDWNIGSLTDAEYFMTDCINSMSTADYSELLIRWEDQAHQDNVTINFNEPTYDSSFTLEGFAKTAGEARTALVDDGWSISDGGQEVVENPFISTWQTDNGGDSNDDQIMLPLESDGTYDFTVNWGDGETDTITAYNQVEVTHTFPNPGEYTISIIGQIEGWRFGNPGWPDYDDDRDNEKITDVSQ